MVGAGLAGDVGVGVAVGEGLIVGAGIVGAGTSVGTGAVPSDAVGVGDGTTPVPGPWAKRHASNACIYSTINDANALLKSIGYNGPTGSYALTSTQRSQAIALHNKLDDFNAGIC